MSKGQASLKDFQKLDLVELRSLLDKEETESFDAFAQAKELFSGLVLKVRHMMIVKQAMKPMVW